jgi:hypothetical protein
MGPNWFDLLGLSIACAIGPGQILFTVLLLQSADRGVLKAGFFVGGMTLVRLVQGIVFGFVLTGASGSTPQNGQPGAIASTLFVILGIFLLITAFKQWRQEDDPDGPPPKWLDMIDSITPVKALGIGSVLVATSPNLWAFALSAIALISQAQLEQPGGIVAFLLFILVAESLLLLTILLRIVAPGKTTEILSAMSAWLTKNNRVLMIAISLVFGLYFLVRGISQLLAL